MTRTWLNGLPTTETLVSDRALAYGDGVFETIRIANGRLVLWQAHLDRLIESCQQLHIAIDPADIIARLNLAVNSLTKAEQGSSILKLVVTRGESRRGYRIDGSVSPNILITVSPWQEIPENQQGVELELGDYRLPENPSLAGIKHMNRLDQVMASRDWKSHIAERLLLSVSGKLIEGTFSNVFLVSNGRVITPSLQLAGVRGVARQAVIDHLLKEKNIKVEQRNVRLAELRDAEEIFLCNSVFGVWPVLKLGLWRWEKGTITTSLQQWFNAQTS